jgi:hypothetical protein
MNKIYVTVPLAALIIGLSFFACLKETSNKRAKPVVRSEATANFSHSRHEKIFAPEGLECTNCHAMGIPIPAEKQDSAAGISKKMIWPGKAECHACHQNESYASKATQSCIKCHGDSGTIMPANHKGDWKSGHKYISKVESKECSKCHKDDFCSECHFKKDNLRQLVHDRNYLFAHSVEARANPHKCTTCHTLTYCKNCHFERGVTK